MNDQLQQRLVASLDKVQEYIEATGEFVIEQAPLVAQEIVQLGRVSTAFQATCFAVGAVVCYLIHRRLWKIFKASGDVTAEPLKAPTYEYAVSSVLFWMGSAALLVTALIFTKAALLPWLAPRLYLLQEIAKIF